MWVDNYRQKLLDNQTIAEQRVGRFLNDMGIEYVPQKTFYINGNVYFADFYISNKRTIIELDGKHHREKLFKEKDKQRDADFSSIGYKTIRIKNEDCYSYLKFAKTLFKIDRSLFSNENIVTKRKKKKHKKKIVS